MKVGKLRYLPAVIAMTAVISGCTGGGTGEGYPITPVSFTSVKLQDDFWAPRIKLNHEVTIPIAFGYCESTGRIKNFEIAGGIDTGQFQTIYPFDDSDVTKIIEGASYSLQTFPDPKLEAYLDTLIWKIGMAQEDDGYLYTNRTIAEMNGGRGLHSWARGNRWEKTNDLSHELYNLGHMYEAAVAHYQATGKRTLLDIALKSADLVDRDFGWDAFVSYPGHQVIEMGLVKLYRVTGEKRYLDLAKFFLDARGHRDDGAEYSQSHMKVVDQTEAVGHSVRATYMYSGMADIAAIVKDEAYVNAITRIWEDIVHRKMYLTGGIGASGGNEGFGEAYHLPNMSAYCETCASIGNIFTNHRLFLMHGESKYFDILEKTLFNSMLSGVSLSADRFFYPNPLESYGQHERSAWFGCACCPSNVARFIPAIPGYIYATTDDELYVNLFVTGTAEFDVGGRKVTIAQKTDYPWDGRVEITIGETTGRYDLKVRIPGWARNEAIPGDLYRFADASKEKAVIMVNGEEINPPLEEGYAVIGRRWKGGDRVELILPMPVRAVVADERVIDGRGKIALQRGPVIFCAEGPDNEGGHILNYMIDREAGFKTEFVPSLLGGTQVIRATGRQVRRDLQDNVLTGEQEEVVLIPYHLWNNRGPAEMMVWLPVTVENAKPMPAPTIAYRSSVSASKPTRALQSVRDQYEPANSNDHSWPYYHWWPDNNSWEWIEYRLEKPERVSMSMVYWFDDGPSGGCRIPAQWRLEYLSGGNWKPVSPLGDYTITKDRWDTVLFSPVMTAGLRLNVRLPERFSSGVHEWIVK
ncbi:MAG: glycoside hydrolase family 127 protein [Bacteroidales bacterium]|jgi:DUF1680 family protein|nr:glycoside hydrolase family 127 protein [Bacteroidales bacterium]